MDSDTNSAFLSENSVTIQNFVRLMFEDCKRGIEKLRSVSNELRTGNKEHQDSIELCHNQTVDFKKRDDELQSAFSTSHDADLSDRVMNLEDYTKKKITV